MYYRIAIRREGNHRDQPSTWQWQSTVLSSLGTLLQWFQFYRALPQDRLRVFSSSSREELNEQLRCENQGRGSNSAPTGQFLRERLISIRKVTAEASAHGAREQREPVPTGSVTIRSCNECSTGVDALVEKGLPVLERKRRETERGAGSDHDLPYSFTLPSSWPQIQAWMRLLARVHSGELQP